jgi:hypothetical protein
LGFGKRKRESEKERVEAGERREDVRSAPAEKSIVESAASMVLFPSQDKPPLRSLEDDAPGLPAVAAAAAAPGASHRHRPHAGARRASSSGSGEAASSGVKEEKEKEK